MNLYGIIGYPLTHSFSKKYFTEKYEREGIENHRYDIFEIKDIKDFTSIINDNPDLKGLNVTIPYKETVMPFLDELDEPVQKIKAVNVIKVNNGKLKGYNSDYHGFKGSLQKFLNDHGVSETSSISALVLGTGGASKAVKAALEDVNIKFKTVSRKKEQADFTYDDLGSIITSNKLIVNTTPLGMYPAIETCPEIPYEKLTEDHFLFDLVYNPEETTFLKKGRLQGARTKNGMEMLMLQAEKAWEIWTQEI